MITRDIILVRSLSRGLQTVPYSQSLRWSDGYRQDCSGYVSMCWAIAPNGPGCWGGGSTETLVTYGYMVPIPWSELQPGDAIGRCGQGTPGNGGHIMLWIGYEGSRSRVRDHGSGYGPKERLVTPPSDYRAFRFVGVSGFSVEELLQPDQFPLQPGNYFGNIAGPAESHGGGVPGDVPFIIAIQKKLIGVIPDGKFGNATEGAVKAFQTSVGLTPDGRVGPETWKKLFTSVVQTPPPSTTPEPTDPILSRLTAIEAQLALLVARPPVVAQIDESSLAEILEQILSAHDTSQDLTPEAITEAVKQAFRDGTD